jgi:hypothetical protein
MFPRQGLDSVRRYAKMADRGNTQTVFHLDDEVEEVATGRLGKVEKVVGTIGDQPDMWKVRFTDGKNPEMKFFRRNESDQLRLIDCPPDITPS